MRRRKKQFNQLGQMLIEVIGATVVVSIILTAAAGALMGNWSAVVRMTQVVPESIRKEKDIKLAFLGSCTALQGSGPQCQETRISSLKQVSIKYPTKETVTPLLIYAVTQ